MEQGTNNNISDGKGVEEEFQRLKENDYILRMFFEQSDLAICYYDIQEKKAHAWSKDTCAKCQVHNLCKMLGQSYKRNKTILPESEEALRQMLSDIDRGKPRGSAKIRANGKDGKRRWFELHYFTIEDCNGKAKAALISHRDITTEWKHESAYQLYLQSLSSDDNRRILFLDIDLSANMIDRMGGVLKLPSWFSDKMTYSELEEKLMQDGLLNPAENHPKRYFSRKNLLELFENGVRNLKKDWPARFPDGSTRWMTANATMIKDSYNNHIKVFFKVEDTTEKKEAQTEIIQRAEQDGMTKLLNRTTAVSRIKAKLADRRNAGILLLLDLDNLKGINDVFGHNEGDKAITTIATTLKEHFRESDIIGRIGGDEFIAYLPGSATNIDTMTISLTDLLQKLSKFSIGDCDNQRIHCSIGCAVQTKEVYSFSVLYKQADKALYHVKRNGKNNFAIYQPEMEEENFKFKKHQLISLGGNQKFESSELQHLLDAIVSYYQLVLSINISSNSYYMMEEVTDGIFAKVPAFGVLDSFVNITLSRIHPDDQSKFSMGLSRESLVEAFACGKQSVRVLFRFMDSDGTYRWTDALAIFYKNTAGEMCDFTLVRWADELE